MTFRAWDPNDGHGRREGRELTTRRQWRSAQAFSSATGWCKPQRHARQRAPKATISVAGETYRRTRRESRNLIDIVVSDVGQHNGHRNLPLEIEQRRRKAPLPLVQ